MLLALKQLFMPSDLRLRAHHAYIAVVEQSRLPVFYQQWQVEDGMDGRFDVIVLHLCLLLDRLEAEGEIAETQHFMRFVSEAFFADMDRSLRELGVGDTGIGHRVKKMAQAFYGRRKAYQEAGDVAALAEAIRRNVFREKAVDAAVVDGLAGCMARNRAALAGQTMQDLLQGRVVFTA